MRTGDMLVAVLAGVLVLGVPGCGGGKKDAREPDDVAQGDEGGGDEAGGDEGGSDDAEVPTAEALDELNRCFAKKRPSVARCYNEALASGKIDKKAHGRITVDLIVTAGGKPTNLTIASDTLGSPEVAGCVKRTIEGWSIPAPGVDTTFSFSYDFEPE